MHTKYSGSVTDGLIARYSLEGPDTLQSTVMAQGAEELQPCNWIFQRFFQKELYVSLSLLTSKRNIDIKFRSSNYLSIV